MLEGEFWAERAGDGLDTWGGPADGRQVERDGQGDEGAEVFAAAGVDDVSACVEGCQVGVREADRDAAGG